MKTIIPTRIYTRSGGGNPTRITTSSGGGNPTTSNVSTGGGNSNNGMQREQNEHAANEALITHAQKENKSITMCKAKGCTRPRFKHSNGALSPVCSYEHYKVYLQQKKPSNNDGDGRSTKLKCYLCGEEHTVMACPKLTEPRKTELTQRLGYTHDLTWWSDPTNRNKAKQHSVTHQWMQRSMQENNDKKTSSINRNNPYHGKATIGNVTIPIFFDLGGQWNLASDSFYDKLTNIKEGEGKGPTCVTPSELGYSDQGVL